MSTTKRSDKKKPPSGTVPEALSLPRQIRKRVRESTRAQECAKPDITYLWIHVSKSGIAQPEKSAQEAPAVEHWLNVVDEAAAFGANWLVVTLTTSLSAYPDILSVCQWAQDTHDMMVGLHTTAEMLTDDEAACLAQLDPAKTRLFVKQGAIDAFASVAASGIKVCPADPQPYGDHPHCRGAERLVFVAPDGILYTCGLVEGNPNYRLGTIFENRFDQLLHDPSLPHAVAENIHHVAQGCDGCPSLIANFLAEES